MEEKVVLEYKNGKMGVNSDVSFIKIKLKVGAYLITMMVIYIKENIPTIEQTVMENIIVKISQSIKVIG